eukprot:scaffold46252_cov131-Skeletonema_marinoi.AAC.2
MLCASCPMGQGFSDIGTTAMNHERTQTNDPRPADALAPRSLFEELPVQLAVYYGSSPSSILI